LYELCSIIHILISSIAMLLILCSGAVYAGGQLLGAETRARANVWAAGMLAGAIIGVLIVLIAPSIFDIMYPGVEYVC
jgi:hypothetical protein